MTKANTAWRATVYHRTLAPRIVESPEAYRAALAEGWADTPAAFAVSSRATEASSERLEVASVEPEPEPERLHEQRTDNLLSISTCLGTGDLRKPEGPHRRGCLKNGNRSGDYSKAPRCGARTRRATSCQCPAIRDRKRCRLHGGLSTGPRTLEGLKRVRAAVLKHGRYSTVEREVAALVREHRDRYAHLATTTRDRLMRQLYAGVAASAFDADKVETCRDLVLRSRLRWPADETRKA